MTRGLEPFEPVEPGVVRLYTCGPTVWNFVHIGNLRTFLFEDVLRRWLLWKGYRVTQVMNLTDIDDKTIRRARELGVALDDYTQPYIDGFFADIASLRVKPADHYPRATRYIAEQVKLIERLTAGGHTYEAEGSIYFRIASFPGYGKLARIDLDQARRGERVEADEYEKEDVKDFVLWKASKPGEPTWETALGPGRPGWHIECSAMAMALLGETLDIHTGGVDNIFPHHENEIAQSEAATGTPFARYWLHAEHLVIEGEKMAKSAGNFFTLRDLLEQGASPVALRYLLVSVPYRSKLRFSLEGIDGARAAVERLAVIDLRLAEIEGRGAVAASAGADAWAEELAATMLADFEAAMDDDLNTAGALAAIHTMVRALNTGLDERPLASATASRLRAALGRADEVLDVLPRAAAGDDTAEIEALVAERQAARRSRDFARADAIRAELDGRGVILEDTPQGLRWRRKV